MINSQPSGKESVQYIFQMIIKEVTHDCELQPNSSGAYAGTDRAAPQGGYCLLSDDAPMMSDREYDLLMDELKDIEKKTSLVLSGSPTQKFLEKSWRS